MTCTVKSGDMLAAGLRNPNRRVQMHQRHHLAIGGGGGGAGGGGVPPAPVCTA